MTRHQVDPTECSNVDSDDLATWLLFYLEAHGAEIVLRPDRSVNVNLDPITGLDSAIVRRWAPLIASLMPEIRIILLARGAQS